TGWAASATQKPAAAIERKARVRCGIEYSRACLMLADLLTAEVARIGCLRATLHIYSCIPEELPTKGNSQQVKNPAGAGLAYRRFSGKLDDIQLRLSYWSVPTSGRRHRFATMHSDAVTLSLAFQATGLIFSSRSS